MPNALSTTIAEDLIEKIQDKELCENDKLPSERELSIHYNVSRNVVRESIKILAEKNLVTNIPGKGNYVSKPTESNIAHKLETAIDLSDVSTQEIIDAREFLETGVMQKYLLSITEEQIRDLENLYRQMEECKQNFVRFSEFDTKFHLYLIGCSRNSILKLFLSTLYNMTRKNIVVDSPNPGFVIQSSQKDHLEIIEAIKSKDHERLNEALTRHLRPLRDFYQGEEA